MSKLLDIRNAGVVEAFVRNLEPDAPHIMVLEHSYHNVIVIVDDARVYRFPRNYNAAVRQQFETEVLRKLRGKTTLPIPEVVAVRDDPSYTILSFLSGQHEVLDVLPKTAITDISEQFARFIFELSQALPVAETEALRSKCGLADGRNDEPWLAYIERALAQASFTDKPWLEELAHEYAAKWQIMQARNKLPLQTVHDDLHNENILFEHGKLAGVLDFGLTNIGTAAQEMRQLYRLDTRLLQAAIDAYARLSGQQVQLEDVKIWAITAELASYCHHLALDETSHPSFVRTRNNLRTWLPEFREHDGALPLKAIIFDCFGVLASEGLRPFRQQYFGHSPSLLQQAVSLGRQVDAGKKSYDTLIAELARMARITPDEVRQHIEYNRPDTALFDCIRTELKHRYKVGLLSNAGDNRLAQIFSPEQIALFDEIALSYQTGHIKPSKQAYADIAARLGVAPSECLFVDDQPRYLAGARAVGMHVIQYKNFDQFRRELDIVLSSEHKSL